MKTMIAKTLGVMFLLTDRTRYARIDMLAAFVKRNSIDKAMISVIFVVWMID